MESNRSPRSPRALALLFLVAFSGYSFGEEHPGFNVGGSFDIGIPGQSVAAPEYIAQEKFVEEMTSVYTWIAANSQEFIQGCREDRESLVSTISGVVSRAQETSSVCSQFEVEAAACNPDAFCSGLERGLPLPPDIKRILNRLGHDADDLTLNDFSRELAMDVCLEQKKAELEKMRERNEAMREKVRSQIPAFREQCERLEEFEREGFDIRLPDIQIPDRPQPPEPREYPRQEERPFENYPGEDFFPGVPLPEPFEGPIGEDFGEGFPEERSFDEGQFPEPDADSREQLDQSPTPEPEQEPEPQTEPAPEPEPEPEQSEAEEQPSEATTSPKLNAVSVVTGFTAIISLEEHFPAEELFPPEDFPSEGFPPEGFDDRDFRAEDFDREPGSGDFDRVFPEPFGEEFGTDFPGERDFGPRGFDEGFERDARSPSDFGRGPGPRGGYGGSAQELCGLSDEEIIDAFVGQTYYGAEEAELKLRCTQEAGRMLQNLNRMKLDLAQCKARAALDCVAKQESVNSCNEIRENPENISRAIVGNMCRRFGVRHANAEQREGLYEVAQRFYEIDPAFANQLGDTADHALDEQENLGVVSYIFGNQDYAQSIMDGAEKLRRARERLGADADQETLSQLDAEIEELEEEGREFENLFDVGRIGRMFR